MANKGLKEYTKQISQTVGDVAKVFVNVNKADANMHIVIPLLTTLGPNPIDLSLIWNYQDKDRMGYFGKGCNINLFKEYSDIESYILVRDADGSYLTYDFDNGSNLFTSKETAISIQKNTILIPGDSDEYTYHFKDLQGNIVRYDNGNDYYPTSIEYANGEKTIFNGLNMDNKRGAKVNFTETNEIITKVSYIQDGTLLYSIDFGYDSNKRMTSVKHYKESKLIKNLSINYSSNEITIKDEILKDYVKYTFTSNCVTKIVTVINEDELNATQTTIAYEETKTILTDKFGKKNYVFFDKNSMPVFEMDEVGNVKKIEFDAVTKKAIRESSILPMKNTLSTLSTPNISMFSKSSSGVYTSYVTLTDTLFKPILEPVFQITGSGSLSYSIGTRGLAGDRITVVIWGRQWTNYTKTSNVKVKITADETVVGEFKKAVLDGNYEPLILGLNPIKSYSAIKITITVTGNPRIDIGGIQVLKKDSGTNYSYDAQGNVKEAGSGKGTVSSAYDSKGLRISSVGKDSTLFNYKYDAKGNVTHAKTAYGGTLEYNYDSYNNVINSVVSNADGSKKLEITKEYDSQGRFVLNETDELGNKTSYDYDTFGKIKTIKDALNVTTEYIYDAFDNLTKILFNKSLETNYSYDSQNKLNKVTLPNGTIYTFDYDSCNNLNSVSMNNSVIVSFNYDKKKGLLTGQTYGSGGTYNFSYNSKQQITDIRFNGILKYHYSYDVNDRLKDIKDGTGNIIKAYTYDNDGQVLKAEEKESVIEYEYNTLGEINRKKRLLNSKTIYESYDNISSSKGFSPDNLIGYLQGDTDYLGTMFLDSAELKNPLYILSAINYNTNNKSNPIYIRKKKVPCVHCGLFNPMSYNPPMKNNTEDCGSIGFWFYPTNLPLGSNKKYLFSIKNKTLPCFVAAYFNSSGKLVLETKDSNNVIETRTIDSIIRLNTWNFFGLNFAYRIDEVGTSGGFSFELYHNSKYLKGTISRTIRVGSITPYHIGYRFDGTKGYDSLECPITALVLGRRFYLSSKQMQDFYSTTKDYILGNSYLDEDSVNFSSTTIYNLSESMLNQFEIYPLQNNVTSLKGKKPVVFDARVVSSTDKDRTFNFNNLSKRCAFMAEGNRLEYDLAMSQTGTILMRAFIKETIDKQYLLECKDSKGYTIGLYREYDTYLSIKVNSSTIKTNLKLPTDIWNTVGISFTEGSISSSTGDQKYLTVRVYLNGNTYTSNIQINTSFESLILSVGRTTKKVSIQTAMGTYETCYPMLGQIEMLSTRAAYCEVETLNTLADELKSTSFVSEYDELGLLNKRAIKKDNEDDVMSINYEYKKRCTPESYPEIECFIRDVEQLFEIKPNESFTFQKNGVYIGYVQDVQLLNPDIFHTKVVWDISEEALDDFGEEGQTHYYHMDQAFMFLENNTWTNTSQYSMFLIDLGYSFGDISYISTAISKETYDTYGGYHTERTYKTNALGHIESIQDSTFGSHTYSYNARGFLTKEDSINYEYDANGNITKVGTITFKYDTTIKDRLILVNGKEISYGTNSLNPNSYDGITYEWEGRRLVGLSKRGETKHVYTYNSNGLRISKSITNENTNETKRTSFYYDGDKLITEISPNYRLDFLYNENDQLYGLIYNNEKKFYYVRDFLKNILGLVDSDGELVVKYGYTAYGKITSITDTSAISIGTYNPFRYKGYYYDIETEMYYCRSRYYVPEWCRWLNADNINYLQFQSINDMNLFCYCKNNPVSFSDKCGTNWWTDIWDWFSNTFGLSITSKKEFEIESHYFIVSTITTGTGYSKSYSNGKPVNLAVTLPTKWYRFWEFSVGIDINVNGYGVSMGLGGEASFGIHAGKSNFDISYNAKGRFGFQYTVQEENGLYSFIKGTINYPEIVAAAALAVYGLPIIAPALPSIVPALGVVLAFL